MGFIENIKYKSVVGIAFIAVCYYILDTLKTESNVILFQIVSCDSDLVELWIQEEQTLLLAQESKKVYYHCDAQLFCIFV